MTEWDLNHISSSSKSLPLFLFGFIHMPNAASCSFYSALTHHASRANKSIQAFIFLPSTLHFSSLTSPFLFPFPPSHPLQPTTTIACCTFPWQHQLSMNGMATSNSILAQNRRDKSAHVETGRRSSHYTPPDAYSFMAVFSICHVICDK